MNTPTRTRVADRSNSPASQRDRYTTTDPTSPGSRRRSSCLLLCGLLLAVVAEAAEPAPAAHRETAAATPAESTDGVAGVRVVKDESYPPIVAMSLPKAVDEQLKAGFRTALRRVQSLAPCQELFAKLGADGVETITSSIYSPPHSKREHKMCKGSAALTTIGGAETRLCPSFGWLSKDKAGMVIIHEALHHAGMSERPRDPDALSSAQINTLVKKSCQL